MVLESLSLSHFRNFSKKEISFSGKSDLIVGPNSIGKTNILEAIYLLASGKSFRVKGVESEMVEYGEEMARVVGKVGGGEQKTDLEIVLTRGEVMGERVAKKKYSVNGVYKRAGDFVGHLRAVYFGPEDLELVTDSPSLRRKYLDTVLSQTDRDYARASLSYEKGLRARNRILEEIKEWRDTAGFSEEVFRKRLYFWDQLLIRNGNILTSEREEYLNFLNSSKRFGVHQLTDEGFEVEYDRSTISVERLAQYSQEEVAAGTTLVGPHRDDFRLKIRVEEARDLAVFGSRGEQRLAILWMKLGELSFVKEKTSDLPVLLLDDIFSELDPKHRKLVLGVVHRQQTIMTTADIGMVDKKWLTGVEIIELK